MCKEENRRSGDIRRSRDTECNQMQRLLKLEEDSWNYSMGAQIQECNAGEDKTVPGREIS